MEMPNNKEDEEDNKTQEEIFRFIQDLEFVQCLANPNYLKYLSDKGYLDNDNFINYLKYLLYFRRVEYMKYITFERCLIFLELLQYKEFREQLKQNDYTFTNGPNGPVPIKFTECLDDFILTDWKDRSMPDKTENNNINDENNKIDTQTQNNENKNENENENKDENLGMDIEI